MKKKPTVHLPLQFFAEPSESTPTDGTNVPASGTEPPAQPTFDDVLKDKAYQAEFDKRMAKAQETALTKARAEWDAQAKAEQEEAARLAKMNAEEKAKHEREKHEKAIAEREAAVTKRELMVNAADKLAEYKLPRSLINCVNLSNSDECEKSIEGIREAFTEAVSEAVNDRLRGSAPPQAGSDGAGKDPFLEGLGN